MLNYNEYRIRLIDSGDIEFITNLRQDYSTNSMLGHFIFVNQESQRRWLESIQNSKDSIYLIFEKNGVELNGRIGIVRINHIDYINRSASVGADIMNEHRGKGYSKIIFKLIFKLGFEYLNLNRLWLHVLENNEIAINLYKKMGFTFEGVQRKAVFREDKYLDYHMMSILKNEYKK